MDHPTHNEEYHPSDHHTAETWEHPGTGDHTGQADHHTEPAHHDTEPAHHHTEPAPERTGPTGTRGQYERPPRTYMSLI